MTQVLTPKPPADTEAYLIDWRQQLTPSVAALNGLLPPAPDPIKTFTLTVTSGTVTVPNTQNMGLVIEATIAGGVDGETSTLHCEVTTYGGQILHRDLSLLISSTAVAITPQTTTKRTVISMGFEELGLADYEFNTTNEEKATALRRLDSLMALWAGPGFNFDLGYNFPPVIGQGSYSDPAGIPDSTLEAVATHLAVRLAPIIGKSISAETRAALTSSMRALRAQYAVVLERRLPAGTIVGAGNKPWGVWAPFTGGGQRIGPSFPGNAISTETEQALVIE